MATLLTAPDISINDNPTITYTNPDGERVTSLQACIDIDDGEGLVTPVKYRDIPKTGSSYTFELTCDEREALYNAVSQPDGAVIVTFRLRTIKDGKTSFSYTNRQFICSPWIDVTIEDVNPHTIALTGDPTVIVRGWSWAKATMTARAIGNASIDESLYVIRNGNESAYSTEHTFEYPEQEFTFVATDSLGREGVLRITLGDNDDWVNYDYPTNHIHFDRPDANGKATISCSGWWFNGSFGAVVNTLTAQCRYTTSGGVFSDDWIDMTITTDGNSYYARADVQIDNFNQALSYIFETKVTDKMTSNAEVSDPVKSIPLYHWSEDDFVFEVPVTFKAGASGVETEEGSQTVDGDLTVTGNLRLKGSGNYGNALMFGDGTYCYISEPTDDVMYIKAKRVDFDANSVNVYGNPIPVLEKGVWTPYLNTAAVSSYTTQYGWYSKMGQTVSVGFYIKANCNSGYTNTAIKIVGLPYIPMFSAAGGGMCSGAYVSAGFNFQCFVAEIDNSITMRVQSCNHTASTNLSTSASGCWYRSGGGEITLSGTITYMATE